jgi:transposase
VDVAVARSRISIKVLKRKLERAEEKCARLEEENQELREKVAQLQEKLVEAERKTKRQAAPFAREKGKTDPKKPGRKKGKAYGKRGARKAAKTPKRVEEFTAPLIGCCPDCGGRYEDIMTHLQIEEDIVREILQRRFMIEVGYCERCGKRAQGRHPLQRSDALGAASVLIGPQALALAAEIRGMGVAYGKVSRVLEVGWGLSVERSSVYRGLARVGTLARPTYEQLVAIIRQSPAVWMDETGWRLEGDLAWLWAAATRDVVVYSIKTGRGFEEASALLGAGYAGILHHDGYIVYESFEQATHQTCLAHLFRRCREMIEAAGAASAECYAAKVRELLLHAQETRRRFERGEISLHGMRVIAGQLLNGALDRLLTMVLESAADERLANHLARNMSWLFTFLQTRLAESTNNHIERELRPAVQSRKTSGGNRTERGAFIHETLISILATYKLQGKDPIPDLVWLQRSPKPMLLEDILAHVRQPGKRPQRDRTVRPPPTQARDARLSCLAA